MTSSCSDVCEEVMGRLLQLGFRFVMDSDDHDDILEALGHVWLVRTDRSGSVCPECGTRMASWCNDGAYVCYQCPTCDTHWEYVDGTYRSTEGSTNCDVHGSCDICEELGVLPQRDEVKHN